MIGEVKCEELGYKFMDTEDNFRKVQAEIER